MCGIIGCIGNFNHYDVITKGLKRLEYRGYDSSGIAYMHQGEIHINKIASEVDSLILKLKKFNSQCAIGHTRWATHGAISLENTHPFRSMNGFLCLAHNGTIGNYLSLKEELLNHGYIFQGETDSEVIANYLEYLYLLTNDQLLAIRKLDQILEGSYSLVILFHNDPELYFLKNQTSLLILKEKEGYILTSDLYVSKEKEITYYELQDHQYGKVNQEVIVYLDKEQVNINYQRMINNNLDEKETSCYLEKEIYQCPFLLKREIDYYVNHLDLLNQISDLLRKKRKIYLIGCGTSYHASLVFKEEVNKECEVILASEFIYMKRNFSSEDGFIFISQSGETLDVIKSMDKVINNELISITNNQASSIARKSKFHLDIMMEKEISVASTKAYFGEVVLLYLLAKIINNQDYYDIVKLPSQMEKSLSKIDEINQISEELIKSKGLYILGKGKDYLASKEGALKIKEITYLHSEAIYLGELKHGPLALVNEEFPCLIIATSKELEKVVETSIKEIKARKGKVVSFTSDKDYPLEFLNQVYLIDLLTLQLGKDLKVNIDKPRNLAKSVTVE